MYTSNRTWLTFFGILIALYLIDEATERLRDNRELPKKKRKWREEKKKKKTLAYRKTSQDRDDFTPGMLEVLSAHRLY